MTQATTLAATDPIWLHADFRRCAIDSGLPQGWQDTSNVFATAAEFRVVFEKGVVFLRLSATTPGKVQVRLPLARSFDRETCFRVTFLGRSSTGAGVLMGVRTFARPEQGDEVDASALFGLGAEWKEHVVTTRGGPIAGQAAFYLNFGAPGTVDVTRITVEEIPSEAHTPLPCIAKGHEGFWGGGWLETHEGQIRRARAGQPAIGWWGDSITGGWNGDGKAAWDREFAPLGIHNFGIGGDKVETVLWRIRDGRLGEDFSPKLVVLMIGINNLFHIDSPADVADGMVQLLQEFRIRLPQARLLMLGVLPCRHDPQAGLRGRIAELNRRYARMADGKNVVFHDVGKVLLEPDGGLSPAIAPDQTHLVGEGYERLARAVAPLVRGMQGTP